MGTNSDPAVTLSPDELTALREIIPGRDDKEREATRLANLADWRRMGLTIAERQLKDELDLRELTDRYDRMKREAIEAFWRERNG